MLWLSKLLVLQARILQHVENIVKCQITLESTNRYFGQRQNDFFLSLCLNFAIKHSLYICDCEVFSSYNHFTQNSKYSAKNNTVKHQFCIYNQISDLRPETNVRKRLYCFNYCVYNGKQASLKHGNLIYTDAPAYTHQI